MTLSGVNFDVAPLKIITKDKEFVDDKELDVGEMVMFLEKSKA